MGKSASKLKKKRSQSIAWSFRFPSLGSLSRPRRMAPPVPQPPPLIAGAKPHLDVRQWLAVLDLTQYGPNFENFSGVEELLSYSEEDIRSLGVRNSAHRARVVSSLVALRAKYEKGNTKRKEKQQRHSVAVDSSRLVHQNGTSDILVVSDAIQSKSLCNLVMDSSPVAPSPGGGSGPASGGVTPVGAGGGGSGPGTPSGGGMSSSAAADAAALRRALEWELSLDSRDLRSHAWYHGAIPRQRAEEIVAADGDFLVRDCTSQPGNFVLTCRSRGLPLHFVINKVVIQPDTVYERVQFQFEDDCYDTVPDLITFYVGSGKSISSMSGARIHTPRNRQFPLSFYATKYGLQQQAAAAGQAVSPLASPLGTATGTLRYNPYNSYRSPVHSPPRSKRETPPRLPSKKQRSHSLTPAELNGRGTLGPPTVGSGARGAAGGGSADERSNSADGVIQNSNGGGKFSTHSLPRSAGMSCTKGGAGMTTTVFGLGALSGLSNINSSAAPHAPPAKSMVRVTSDPALSPCMERRRFGYMTTDLDEPDSNLPDQPPPKPSRIPSLLRPDSKDGKDAETGFENGGSGDASVPIPAHGAGTFQRVASYHASGSDSGNGSGDSAQSSAAGDAADATASLPPHRGVVIKNPRYMCGHTRRPSSGGSGSSSGGAGGRGGLVPALEYDSAAEDSLLMLAQPDPEPATAFDLENFVTLLLPSVENKPLDASALQSLRMMLQETGPRVLANHLTRVDLELTAGGGMQAGSAAGTGWESDLGLGITCGLELCSLPHGRQLRLDLIERTECLKLLVAVTILTCTTEAERAEVLNKWIQVAIDTKTALGNLYGFCGIMMGLCMPQVQRLTSTWHVLRQKFTDSAFNFEAKLRPTLKSMNECSNPQAPNTTIPHLLPFILLLERSLDDILGTAPSSIMATSVLGSWESSTADFGLGTLYAHLEAARKFGESLPTFRRNAEIVLGDSKVDDLLLDAFRTEFHLKFLWGSRGATVAPADRHTKFDQVLCVMSEKCEAPSPVHTPVGTAV